MAGARAELVARFGTANASTVTGVDRLFDHLPGAGDLTGGVSVCVFLVEIDPESWHFAVRAYMDATGRGMKKAQDDLDVLLPALDAALSAPFGPSNWRLSYPTESELFFSAEAVLAVGREDYY